MFVTVDDMSGLAGKVLELWALSDGERSKLSERTRSKVSEKYEIGTVITKYESFYEGLALQDIANNRCK